MTENVVVFCPGTVEAAAETLCVVLESHMTNFTDVAKRQFVKRVCKLVVMGVAAATQQQQPSQ
jgi:hypothetical protein